MKDTQHPRVNDNFTLEKFDNEILLYNETTTQAVYLNDAAHAVYLLCTENMNIGQIIEYLEQTYPEQKEQIREDVVTALETLQVHGIVTIDDGK